MPSETLPKHAYFACVLYDPKTGDIRHVHRVAVLPGAESPTKQQVQERALALAKKLGRDGPARLRVLHVSPESIKPGSKLRVDLKKQRLVSEPIQGKRS